MAPAERPALALHGRTLAIAESGPVRQPTFTYHRTRVSTVRLSRNRLGFQSTPRRKVVIRTSIGPLAAAHLALDGRGNLLAAAGGRGFAGPVVWCCTPDGEERVVYSDGRGGAPRPISVAFQGPTARALLAAGSRLAIVERSGDGVVHREDFAAPGRAPFGLGSGRLASVVPPPGAAIATHPVSARRGPVALTPPRLSGRRPAGRVRGVWVDGNVVVALVRRGRFWEVHRYSAPQRRRLLMRSVAKPRHVAVGRGAVAAAVGRTVWTGRGNRRLRRGPRATSAVAALAADANRVAWLERRGRGKAARYRLRLARVR